MHACLFAWPPAVLCLQAQQRVAALMGRLPASSGARLLLQGSELQGHVAALQRDIAAWRARGEEELREAQAQAAGHKGELGQSLQAIRHAQKEITELRSKLTQAEERAEGLQRAHAERERCGRAWHGGTPTTHSLGERGGCREGSDVTPHRTVLGEVLQRQRGSLHNHLRNPGTPPTWPDAGVGCG